MSDQKQKPVYADGERAVFTDSITNKTTGETTETYSYVRGRGPDAERISVRANIAGYELANSNNPQNKFSDVVRLVEGEELLVPVRGKGGADYYLLLAPIGITERQGAANPAKIYKHLNVEAALAEIAKPKEGEPVDTSRGPRARAFLIHSIGPDGKPSEKRDLKCYRDIPIQGSVSPKDAKKNRWFRLLVADALKARDALAAGKTIEPIRHSGAVVTFEGLEAVPPTDATKVPTTIMKFKAVAEVMEQGAPAPLPSEARTASAGAARR